MKREFKLIGLNKPWKSAGFNSIYATVEKPVEDWFHAPFDSNNFSDEELNKIFDMFKNSEENLWHKRNHKVIIDTSVETKTEGQYGVIVELILDGIK